MTQLYPIGTQLITRRLSQAALAYELGFFIESFFGYRSQWRGGFWTEVDHNDVSTWRQWRITVTEENQKWLSPVPIMPNDVVEVMIRSGDVRVKYYDFFVKADLKNDKGHKLVSIVQRTYPNGQCAPVIEWDEVILPKEKNND